MCFRIHCRSGGRKETMGGKGVIEKSKTEEDPGLEMTEGGWVVSWDGGCQEKKKEGCGKNRSF